MAERVFDRAEGSFVKPSILFWIVLRVFCGEIVIFVELICNLLERGSYEMDR